MFGTVCLKVEHSHSSQTYSGSELGQISNSPSVVSVKWAAQYRGQAECGHVAYLDLSYPVERVSRLLPSTHVRSGWKTSNGIEKFLIRGVLGGAKQC
jgi:hypothetical protein